VLAAGFPRESTIPVEIGGVRTNFRMPDLLALALGGGTVVKQDGALRVGPESVGHRLTTEGQCFGGETLTVSDIVNAGGRASFGTHSVDGVEADTVASTLRLIDEMLEDGVDRMKLARSDQPVIAVGGGSVVVAPSLAGASEIHRPENFDVANAIGAAIAAVSAEIDQLFTIGPEGRDAVIDGAKNEAINAAVAVGSDPDATEVVSLEELTMAYMTDNILRLRIKAAGPLR
jgi:N-methylhydantoinase A/oxoprolinase/acetone carboxylase beta subunit